MYSKTGKITDLSSNNTISNGGATLNIKSSSLLTSSETILTRPINNNVEENNKAAKSKTINANYA